MFAIGQDDNTQIPIGSTYGILFTYIWLIFMVNVCKYGIHGCYGFTSHQFVFFFTENSSSRPFVVDSLECTRQVLVHNLRYPLRLTCNLRIHPGKGQSSSKPWFSGSMLIFRGVWVFILIFRGKWVIVIAVNLFHLLKINNSNIPCVSLEARFLRSFRWKPTWEKIGELFFVCVKQCLLLFDLIWWKWIRKIAIRHSTFWLRFYRWNAVYSLGDTPFQTGPKESTKKRPTAGLKNHEEKQARFFGGRLPWIVNVDGSRWRVLLSRLSRLWKHGQSRYHFLRRQRGP